MSILDTFSAVLTQSSDKPTYGYVGEHNPIASEEGAYLTITVQKLYLPYVRKVSGKFYGAIYGNVTVPYKNGKDHVFQAVNSIDNFKEIDSHHLDRIVQLPFDLVEDVPYYDTGVDISISLLAIKSADLVSPYIKLLKSIADTAGVAFISQIVPYASILENGMLEIISRNTLEIGQSGKLRPVCEGVYVVIGTEKERLPLDSITYDMQQNCLQYNGTELTQYSYFVLHISQSDKREKWASIPELSSSYGALTEQVERTPTNFEVNMQAFEKFRRTMDLSPELLDRDAARLIEEVRKELEEYLYPPKKKPAVKSGALRGGQKTKADHEYEITFKPEAKMVKTLGDIRLFR